MPFQSGSILTEDVSIILMEALRMRASKIHIEPGPQEISVRFRIDGDLHQFLTLPLERLSSIVHSLKKLSDLDIGEDVLPQDSIIELTGSELQGRYAVSFIPGLCGPKVLIAPYSRGRMEYCLDSLGLEENQLVTFREAINSPKPSLIIVAGPTDSGKNTMVYSALQEMRKRNYSIATAEWEHRGKQPGVHQVIADEDRGLNFAAIARALLRTDVDVIFIRDLVDYETAELAFKAVLDKNRFVLTAMHCFNAMSTINRLTNIGIEHWLIAEAVSVIQGQRLLRRLCNECKEETSANEKVLVRAGLASELAREAIIHRAKGCRSCSNTGYHGMILVAETFRMTDSFALRMFDEPRVSKIGRYAVEEGMETLRQNALKKMLAGLTSLDEVLLRTPSDT